MKRSHQQNTRRFLANCFKNDNRECRNERLKNGTIEFLTTRTFLISITKIDGPVSDECCEIRISFFNTDRKCFVGKSYSTEIGDEDFMFHGPVDTTLVVYESVQSCDDIETVSCWGYTALSALKSTRCVSMMKGSARLLDLDRSVWPKSLSSVANLYIDVTVPSDIVFLSSLIPQCVGVPKSYAPEVMNDGFPPHSFRVRLSKLEIRECTLPFSATVSPFEGKEGSWNCLVFAHNMHMILSYCTEISLSLDTEGNLISMKEVEIPSLPKHKDTSLVIAVRFKGVGDRRFRTVGYSVFGLMTDIPEFGDCDVNIHNLPFLRGPFSCEDPRCTNLESDDRLIYTPLPLMGNAKISYYETLVLGKRVEKYVCNGFLVRSSEGSAHRKSLRMSEPLLNIPTPSDDGSLIAKDHTYTHESSIGTTTLPKYLEKPEVAGLERIVASKDEKIGEIVPSIQTNIYKMLSDIMEEVKAIRLNQERDVPYEEYQDPMMPDNEFRGKYVRRYLPEKNVLSLNRVRKTLDPKRRLAINENLRPLFYPTTGERLVASDVVEIPKELPNSQYMIRFEGITFSASAGTFQLPRKLVIIASYANLPMIQMGAMYSSKVYDADSQFSSSYSLSDIDTTGSTGYIWVEPKEIAESAAFIEYKKTGIVYLHLYDGTTSFYIASANLKLNLFQRLSSSIFTCDSFDLMIYEDLSHTERTLPEKAPLVLHANVGYLHITVASVGVPSVSINNEKLIEENTTNIIQPTRGGKAVVVANKISADFGADTLEAAYVQNDTSSFNGNQNKVIQTKGTNSFGEPQVHLHTMRAQYVRKLLHDQISNSLALQMNGGKLPSGCSFAHSAENEFKLRYVEKRRDEVKSAKIQEALKARTTSTHHVCTWMGSPKIIDTLFVNPFPCTVQYLIETPPQGKGVGKHVALHPDTPSVFTLGPKQDKVLRTVIRVLDHPFNEGCENNTRFSAQFVVKTSKLETARTIIFHVYVISPVIHRRYKIFAASNTKLVKRLYCRPFPPTHNAESLMEMCHQVKVSDGDITAITQAVVEPLTATSVAAVEEVHISCDIGDAPRKYYLFLFKDNDFIDAFETWEIEINPCQLVQTRSVPFGQTTIIALPIVCDQLYSADGSVEPFCHVDCSTLRVTPHLQGVTNTVLLHAMNGSGVDVQSRFMLCDIPSISPTPSYEDFIEVSSAMSNIPIFRRLQFTNQEQVQKNFRIFSTYRGNLRCTPEQFQLAPQQCIQIGIQIFNLKMFGGEGRWPMWIFVNDSENHTVDSYLIHVSVRNFIPITN